MASSNYIVSAIKYRPNTFAEVLAQDHITRTLQHSLKRGRIANAYLFSGPRGTGKTTTARILAKALNCENLKDGDPCGQCETCRMITQGIHPDILEIDAASNTGVDNIRELRENARFTPSLGRFKIYIIDECHMLSQAANNALLKTLEEPPAHCRFILATTELQKILPTILSRCQRFPFRRIPSQIIVEHLRYILEQQPEIELADPSQLDRILFLLARSSEGCLRDALFSLDQLIAFCSGKLDLPEVEEVMGAIEFDLLDRYIRALIQHDLPVILEVIEKLANQGKEMAFFLSECLQFLRNLAVIKVSAQNVDLLDLPDEYRKQLMETAALTPLEQILYMTDQLWDAEIRIRNSSMGRIIMEMASLKAAKAGQAIKIEDLLQKISAGGGDAINIPEAPSAAAFSPSASSGSASSGSASSHATPVSASTQSPPKTADPPAKQTELLNESIPPLEAYENSEPPVDQHEEANSAPLETSAGANESLNTSDSLNTIWRQFLKELEGENPMLAGALEGSIALDINGDVLQIAIPSDNMYSLRTIERPNNREILAGLIQQSFGKKLTLRCEPRDDLNLTKKPSADSPSTTPALSRKELMEKVQQNKIFSKLMEEMPGRVVDIKPERSN